MKIIPRIILILLIYLLVFDAKGATDLERSISEKVKNYINKNFPNKNFKVIMDPFGSALAGQKTSNIDLVKFHFRTSSNRFFAHFSINGKAKLVTGRLNMPRKVPVLVHALGQGEVIQETDIGWQEISSEMVDSSIITNKEKLVGKSLKRNNLRANTPIRHTQIEAHAAIKRGDKVQIMFKTPCLVISNVGIAKEDGNVGQIINFEIENSDSVKKKIIQGRVIGPTQAEILRTS